jgi:hypothetical protein
LFSGGERRIHGLKFVELTKEQEDRLDHLLELCFDRSVKQACYKGVMLTLNI